MNLSEFELQERGPYLFGRWLWEKTVETPLGNFEVGFQQGDGEPRPDEEMLHRAEELVHFTEQNADYIADIVFGYYRLAEESDPNWLSLCDVPRGLTKAKIGNFLNGLWLIVSRNTGTDSLNSTVLINPFWDEEHKMNLEFQNGRIVSFNDSAMA